MSQQLYNSRLHNKFDNLIPEIRTKVIETVPKDDVYESDIENKIKSNDTFIRRFLDYNNGKVNETVDQLIKTLKWYKEMKFNELSDAYFPIEMWSLGGVFIYEPDLQGHPSLFVRLRSCIKVTEINEMVKKYISYLIWKLDTIGAETGWVMIFDFESASVMNADTEIAKHFVSILKNYFPLGLNYSMAVDTPWYIRTFWSVVKGLLPADKRSLLMVGSKEDLKKYFKSENLPKFVGGTCTKKFQGPKVVPDGAISSIDFGVKHLGFQKEKSEKLFKNFDHLIKLVDEEEVEEK